MAGPVGTAVTEFQDRCLKPLGHPSKARRINSLDPLPGGRSANAVNAIRQRGWSYYGFPSPAKAALIASAAFGSCLANRWAWHGRAGEISDAVKTLMLLRSAPATQAIKVAIKELMIDSPERQKPLITRRDA